VRAWGDPSGEGEEYHIPMPDECAGFVIPDRMKYYKTAGSTINIFVFGWEAEPENGSWGAPCVVDTGNYDEPVYGAIWINTQLLTTSSDADNFHNMLRQTFHVLAFHNHLYDRWVDSSDIGDANGVNIAPHSGGVLTESSENGRTVYTLTSPIF
jgi:hypothetical protein